MGIDDAILKLMDAPVLRTAPKRERPVSDIHITPHALEKAHRYAELACEELETPVECYGYLISPKETKDRVARDIYLAPRQTVNSAHVGLALGAVTEAGRELHAGGYRVLGWWHSHADFQTFHSSEDDENIVTVLHGIGATNYVAVYRDLPFMDAAQLAIRGRACSITENASEGPVILADLGAEHPALQLPVNGVQLRLPIQTGFAYSVVVNAIRGKPFAQIATKEYCYQCAEGAVINEPCRLSFVETPYTISMDERAMRAEIRTKIKRPREERRSLDAVLDNLESFFKGGGNGDIA